MGDYLDLECAIMQKMNLILLFIECVENDITLGEVCGALRGV